MRLTFEVGSHQKSQIEFCRNWITGRAILTVDGRTATLASPWRMSTHRSPSLVHRYILIIDGEEKHEVIIERERPRFFGGVRPHKYRVYVDGELMLEQAGF